MNRPVIAALLFVAVVMGGCTEPRDPEEATEPTPYAPEGHVLPAGSGQGSAGSVPLSGWFLWVGGGWSQALVARDAVLNLSIEVEGKWRQSLEPFEESGWMFRLHAETGHYNKSNVYRGVHDLPEPAGADWYRNYTLQGIVNTTVSHPTSFRVGDLRGEVIVFRLTYHKVHESGFWTANECEKRFSFQGEAYVAEDGEWASCREVCASRESGLPCPWSGKPGHLSSPPPDNW